EHQRDNQQYRGDGADAAGPGRALDDEGHQSTRLDLAKRPEGRSSSTARKTRWPVMAPQPGEIRGRAACSMPNITPPASVPQREPRPPMITASKAKSSRSGPLLNENVVRTPRETPARARMAGGRARAST